MLVYARGLGNFHAAHPSSGARPIMPVAPTRSPAVSCLLQLVDEYPLLPTGELQWRETVAKPGDGVVFRALVDCITVMAACVALAGPATAHSVAFEGISKCDAHGARPRHHILITIAPECGVCNCVHPESVGDVVDVNGGHPM